jgi:hypothetical protein
MIIYILFHETNTGHSQDSDGYVEAVYATEEHAERVKRAAIRAAVSSGEAVYWDPETEIERAGDWEHDWRVEAHEVYTDVRCPECQQPAGAHADHCSQGRD